MTYDERAERLSKAVDIAIKIVKESTVIKEESKSFFLEFYSKVQNYALNPEPQFKKIASIKYLENDFLTFWNESSGVEVEKFWKEIYKNGIGFEKKDTFRIIFNRGKIKSIQEYDFVIDNIVAAEQIGRLNKDQVVDLNIMINDFEIRNEGKDL